MNMKELYQKKVVPQLKEQLGYKNIMAVPRISQVVVNTGFGKLIATKTGDDAEKTVQAIVADLSQITGQKAQLTTAKKSVAGFKLREGIVIGAKITLHGKKMYDFLDRFIGFVLPRSRDFLGLNASAVDNSGNLTIGIKEHLVFPVISPEKVRNVFGLEVTVVTTAKTREEGLALFKALKFPIKE